MSTFLLCVLGHLPDLSVFVWLPPQTDLETRIGRQVIYSGSDFRKRQGREDSLDGRASWATGGNPPGDLWGAVADTRLGVFPPEGQGSWGIYTPTPSVSAEGCSGGFCRRVRGRWAPTTGKPQAEQTLPVLGSLDGVYGNGKAREDTRGAASAP